MHCTILEAELPIMLIVVSPKVPQLRRMFKRTRVLVPHTKSELSYLDTKGCLYQMVVHWVFDVRKSILVGISLPARMSKLSTQSSAHARSLLSVHLSAIKSENFIMSSLKMRQIIL